MEAARSSWEQEKAALEKKMADDTSALQAVRAELAQLEAARAELAGEKASLEKNLDEAQKASSALGLPGLVISFSFELVEDLACLPDICAS